MNRKGHIITGLIFGILAYIYFFKDFGYEFIIALAIFVLGSLAPDIDLKFGIGYHRSFITHSPLILVLFGWIKNPYFSVFLAGWAVHLFFDSFNLGSGKLATGDIRGVPEWAEFPLLIGSTILILVVIEFLPGVIF